MDDFTAKVRSIQQARSWEGLPALADWVVDEALRIQQIPAPTFAETSRALYVADRFREMEVDNIEVDHVNNVYARLKGKTSAAALMILAHTDTVFPAETNLTIKREGERIIGPGIGDNSLGVASMLGLAKTIGESREPPACDIWLVADACEEGLGDLKGAKAAYARLKDKIDAVINLEGLALGHVYNAGTAVHRLRIRASAAGGHSWLNFGKPSAVHGILALGNRILALDVPQSPRSTRKHRHDRRRALDQRHRNRSKSLA